MVEMAYKTYLRFKLVLGLLTKSDMSTHEIRDETNIPSSTIYKMMGELQLNGVVKVINRRLTKEKLIHRETIWGLTDGQKTVS